MELQTLKHVLITGASSGLGAALALDYAAAFGGQGVRLSLCGRDEGRLRLVAEEARSRGAVADVQIVDVTDSWAMEDWIKEADARAPLDLVIANAGISAGTGKGEETKAQALDIMAVNVQGVLNTIFPTLPLMKARGRGQIAIMSSLAGFRGLPGAPAYGASKAAVRVYGEALRCEMAPHGVKVNVICPGFIKTPMTEVNDFPMPFLMETTQAARVMRKGLEANKARIAFPRRMAALVWLLNMLPAGFTDWLVTRLPRKN